jgi:hypothetical protein
VSLFAGTTVQGCEVNFRAVCALGWELHTHFNELREICDALPQTFDVIYWIDEIEGLLAPLGFSASDAATWPQSVAVAIHSLAQRPKFARAQFSPIKSFLKGLISGMTGPQAQDPALQFVEFNRRGFTLAEQMINDPQWSTKLVQQRWRQPAPHACVFRADKRGNFQPVTMGADGIDLRVNTKQFDIKNALLFYMTLEFQMMHEYISHVLPVWNSGNPLEEEFLLAVMSLYYRDCGPNDGHAFLVQEADDRRADAYRHGRQFIKYEVARAVMEQRLSQILLELAVLDDNQMEIAKKRKLLALLKKLPLKKTPLEEDAHVRTSVDHWLRTEGPLGLTERLSGVLDRNI